MSGLGERSNRRGLIDEMRYRDGLDKCPQCGQTAFSRYWCEKRRKFIYRHTTRMRDENGKVIVGKDGRPLKETKYHEANS